MAAAYGALVSIMQIIHQIQTHPFPPISLHIKQAESLTELVSFLQEFLHAYNSPFADSNGADPLEMRIADAAYAAEDVIESNIVDRILSNRSASQKKKKMGFFSWPSPEEPAADGERQIDYLDLYEGLQKVIDDLDLSKKEAMEMRITDAAYAAEDVIESNIVDRILSNRSENQRKKKMGFFSSCFSWPSPEEPAADGDRKINSLDLYEGLQKVIDDLDLIKKEAMEIIVAENKKDVVRDQLRRQVSASSSSSSPLTRPDNSSTPSLTGVGSTAMVGCDDACLEILDKLTGGERDRQLIPIVGMGGIGKTTLARAVYSNPLVKGHFDFCAWATISLQHNKKQILCEILSQTESKGERLSKMREDELELELHKCLWHRRFLIVLDDMWSIEAWENIQHSFPNDNNSSRILVTTRLSNLAAQLDSSYRHEMKFLDEVSCWSMFSKLVFGEEICPVELEKIGMKIAKDCKGLPLSIAVMGGLIAKQERTKESWESIWKKLNSVKNSVNDDHCLKILKTSYDHLPIHLKPCFLYMGVFEEDSEIRVSTLIRLWVSEGFLKPASGKSLETVAKEYLKDLVDRNLILVVHKPRSLYKIVYGLFGDASYCKIHDLLRDLCLKKAQKERFYHVLGHATCSQRRIVIPKGTSQKEVLKALESMPLIRSYISEDAAVGPLPNLRFLRILKTYERDVYNEFRHDLRNMFELVNTRYLGVGAHPDLILPSSINLLWNLQTMIIAHPRKVDAPVEIWKMAQLRHVHFCKRGLYLPSPPSDNTVVMENLQTLKGVRNFMFDEEMVQRIPNVMRLGLKYDDDDEERGMGLSGDYYCVRNVKCLSKLESLSCEGYENLHMMTFPESLRKLTLSAVKCVWQGVLEKIGLLPHLQKLRLRDGEFRGGKWETVEGGFPSLKFLSLFMSWDLEKWTMESSSHFPCLERLYLSYLKRLEEIPAEIGEIPTLQSITLVCCSESAVMSGRKIIEEQEELQGEDLPYKVEVYISEKNQEVQRLANPNFQVVCALNCSNYDDMEKVRNAVVVMTSTYTANFTSESRHP